MNEPFTLKPGSEAPLGASLDSKGCNFAVWAPEATAVILCLYDGAEQELARFSLKERKGQYWFGYVAGVKAGLTAEQLGGHHNPQRNNFV